MEGPAWGADLQWQAADDLGLGAKDWQCYASRGTSGEYRGDQVSQSCGSRWAFHACTGNLCDTASVKTS